MPGTGRGCSLAYRPQHQPLPGSHCAVSRWVDMRAVGTKLMIKRDPVAFAKRSSVRIDGRPRPLSSRATTGCVVPIFRASASCVRPARLRTPMAAAARTNSSSSAAYAFRYLGSFIHSLCRSDMRAIATPPSSNRFRAEQGQIDLTPRRFLRLLHEYAHDDHPPAHGRHI